MNRTKITAFAVIAFALIETARGAMPPSDFQQVLANPKAFDGKCVTLIGVADIGGAEFFLYPDARAAKQGDYTKAIFVDGDIGRGHRYEEFNNHWLEITGIVDMRVRPPLGLGPCSIVLKRLQPLSIPPIKDESIKGVFKNDTGKTIDVNFSTPSGGGYIVNFPPGDVSAASVITRGFVTATNRSGKLLAKGDLPTPGGTTYFDAKNRTYYYRITRRRIELVRRSEVKQWKKGRGRAGSN